MLMELSPAITLSIAMTRAEHNKALNPRNILIHYDRIYGYSKFRSYIWGRIRPTLTQVDIMLAMMFWYIVSREVGTAFDRLQCKCWLTTDLLPTLIHNITVSSL